MPSGVLSEPGGVIETEHVVFCWIDVKDGSVEPLPVVIHKAVQHGCHQCSLSVEPGIIAIPSGNSVMLIVIPVLVSILGYDSGGLLGLLQHAIVYELNT